MIFGLGTSLEIHAVQYHREINGKHKGTGGGTRDAVTGHEGGIWDTIIVNKGDNLYVAN